jgi:hypothetical protein
VANTPVSPSASVKLSAAGAGQVGLTPPSGVMWQLSLASVSIPSPVKIPQVFLSLGNSNGPVQLLDSSYAGASASSGKVAGTPIYPGTYIWAAWTGADANATAMLQLFGMAVRNYRRAGT